jgi:hypothetical protein
VALELSSLSLQVNGYQFGSIFLTSVWGICCLSQPSSLPTISLLLHFQHASSIAPSSCNTALITHHLSLKLFTHYSFLTSLFTPFQGTLPSELGFVTTLQSIHLSGNLFSGTLPPSWSALVGLTELDLSSNMLSGTLPPEWSTLSLLYDANLASNTLHSELPTAWDTGLTSLVRLVVDQNVHL